MSNDHMRNHRQTQGGARAFENGDKPPELDGLRVVFDQKVGLYPVSLHKKGEPRARKVPARAAGLSRRRMYAH